jgi:hypothetical protein
VRLFPGRQSREEYLRTQIERSERKFRYCKVSIRDALRYRGVVLGDLGARGLPAAPGPILCLGTRNGREVDLFRVAFFGSAPRRLAAALLEHHGHSFRALCPPLEAWGRSDAARPGPASAVGVEVNPRGARRDVWTGSFDEMPAGWADAFGVVYSNSFDQSQDPGRTAREWTRVTRPGGYVIVGFAKDADPSPTDPVGGLRLADVLALFPGELVYYRERGSRAGHSEAVIRVAKGRP